MLTVSIGRRVLAVFALAGVLAFAPGPGVTQTGPLSAGALAANAQGRMDIDLVSPTFSELPSSVQPGQQFTVTAATATGARCVGELTFRNQPPIALDDQPAPAGACSWAVTVPLTARPGSGTVAVQVSRNGQTWGLYGITYVSPVGESR